MHSISDLEESIRNLPSCTYNGKYPCDIENNTDLKDVKPMNNCLGTSRVSSNLDKNSQQ